MKPGNASNNKGKDENNGQRNHPHYHSTEKCLVDKFKGGDEHHGLEYK